MIYWWHMVFFWGATYYIHSNFLAKLENIIKS